MFKSISIVIKFLVIVLLSSTYSIFMFGVYADDSNSFNKRQNAVYQFIDDHDWVLVSLSDMIAGGVLCGPWCVAAGGLVGAINEGLVYFGYTDRHYLTSGILGAAVGNMINPSLMYNGAIVGALLPTGFFNEHQELIAPIVSGMSGYAESRTAGLIRGALGGAIDEVSIYNELTDKHYITAATIGTTLANVFLHAKIVEFVVSIVGTRVPARVFGQNLASFLGVAFSLIAVNYEDVFIDSFKGPVKVAQDLYHTYIKFIRKHLKNPSPMLLFFGIK